MRVIENINYADLPDTAGKCDLYLPEVSSGFPVLLIHGGGWSGGNKEGISGIAEYLCQNHALPVLNINYRLSGNAPWPACGDDCLEAAKFLLQSERDEFKGMDRSRIFSIGVSSGGHLALMTGMKLDPQKVAGIVSISGIADPKPDYLENAIRYQKLFRCEDVPDSDLELMSPLPLLSADTPPILCTHAFDDNVVPLQSVKNFLEASKRYNVSLETYFYKQAETGRSHRIWIPGVDSPRRLYPDLEERISEFIKRCSAKYNH